MLSNIFIISVLFNCLLTEDVQIAVPEYICDTDGKIKEIDKDITKIRIFGKDAQQIHYKFNVNFKRIGKLCRNKQRCTLMTWKVVRAFQSYLQNTEIKNGMIEFNNTMLMPGIKYILNIVMLNDGNIIDEKNYTLDFVNEDVKQSIKKPMASILLLGSNTAYAYMNYYLNAEVTICSNVSSYYIEWTLFDSSNNNLEALVDRSLDLVVKPGIFQAKQTYLVNCQIIDNENEESIAEKSQSLNILSRGLLLKLPFDYLMTRSYEPLNINAYFMDLDNEDGEILFKWYCTEDNENCLIHGNTNYLNIENGLPEGKYKISIEASKGEYLEIRTCEINTLNNVPIIEIDTIKTPISPSAGVTIHARVLEVKTFCVIQWTSVKKEDYEFLDLDIVPGNVNVPINVTLKEDLFLHELEEFSNGTIDKELVFTIPPPEGLWPGLKGDVIYSFRLTVSCPNIQDYESYDYNEIKIIQVNYSTIYADVSIETNAAPSLTIFDVTPTSGEALKTSFSFKTQSAFDKEEDKPILYKFGYVYQNRQNFVCYLFDIVSCNAILPYSDKGILTVLEVCDNFNSCNKQFGPIIETLLPQDLDYKIMTEKFKQYLITDNYEKAFIFATSVIHTYGYIDNNLLPEISNEIFNSVNQKIDQLVNLTNEKIWQYRANMFLKSVNDFNADLKFSQKVLQNLERMINKISSLVSKYEIISSRKLLSELNENNEIDIDSIKSYLGISEIIILHSESRQKVKTEKEKVKHSLINYMENLCPLVYNKDEKINIELQTLQLEIEKLNINSANKFYVLPSSTNKWNLNGKIKLGQSVVNLLNKQEKYCIGKALFKNYLNDTKDIFLTEIVNFKIRKIENIVGVKINVFLPISYETNVECIVGRNGVVAKCKTVNVLRNYIQCNCPKMGYFMIRPLNNTAATEISNLDEIESMTITTTTVAVTATLAQVNSTIYNNESSNYSTLSYVITFICVIGIGIMVILIKRITNGNEDEDSFLTDLDFPKYAQLHDEEMLDNLHI